MSFGRSPEGGPRPEPEPKSEVEELKATLNKARGEINRIMSQWDAIKGRLNAEQIQRLGQELEELKETFEQDPFDVPDLDEDDLRAIAVLLDRVEALRAETGVTGEIESGEGAERRKETPEGRLNKKLESLGLTAEAITESVPEFNELSQGKQLLVLENLQQLTLGRIQEEAQDKYRGDVQESKFLGRIWKGVTKQWQIKSREKATANELQKGGMEAHGAALQQLTELTKYMPEVEVQADGKLAIGYAEEFENGTHEQKYVVGKFNRVANAFARIPEEWSFSTAGKTEQRKYKAAKQAYDEARNKLLAVKKESLGESVFDEARAMRYVNEAEFAVRMNQFLNTHPDVEKQLHSITDERAWTKAFKDVFAERSGLFAAGFAARSTGIALVGWAAAPIVAAGLGAWRGRVRAKETLQEREKAARKGVKDTSKEAKNVVDADKTTGKLWKQLEKIIAAVTAGGVTSDKELASLKARIDYMREKMDAGRMNYGSPEQRLQNRYLLLQAIGHAESMFYVHGGDVAAKSELDERLDRFLDHKEQKITKAQSAYIKKQMLKGAAYGAGFAFSGAGIRHVGGQAAEAIGLEEKFGRLTSLWGRDEALETPPTESAPNVAANVLPGSAEFVGPRLESEQPAPPPTPEAPEAGAETSTTPEAVEAVEITDQGRIAQTAKHFRFEETEDGGLRLDMAEAAKENANLGKLEQVLDRLVAAQYVDEFGESLEPEEAAKILNMAANLRVAFEHGDASFMDKWPSEDGQKLSDLFKDSLEYDMDKQTLTISDQAKFEQLVDGLKAHADELATQNKLEGAVGELPKIKQETWRDIVNAAQEKNIQVDNYVQDPRVMQAYEANQAREAAALEAGATEAVEAVAPKPRLADLRETPDHRLVAKDFSPDAVARGLHEYDRVAGKTLGLNGKLGVIYDTFHEKYPDISESDAREHVEYRYAFQNHLTQDERNTLHELRPYEEAKPGGDRAQAARLVAEYDNALPQEARVRQYADVRATLAQAKLERALDEAGRFSGKHEQIFEGVSRLAGEQGAMKPDQAHIFTRWLAERGGDETLSEGDLKKLGLWDNKAKTFDQFKLNSYMDTFVSEAQGRRTIDALPTQDKSEWTPVSLRGENGRETFGLVQHVSGSGEQAVYSLMHPERGEAELAQGLSRAQVQEMLYHDSTAFPSEAWGDVPETKFLGVSIPTETLELTFADKYSALERENLQDYFDDSFASVHEMERQFPEWRQTYGDRPQFAAFEDAVRKNMQQTMRHLNGIARAVEDPAREVRTFVSGSMSAAESARMRLELTAGMANLRTLDERMEDLHSEMEELTPSAPESPVPPQEAAPEPAPAAAQAAEAGFGEMENTQSAIEAFKNPALSYEQKMAALKGVMADGERMKFDSFDLARSGDRIMAVTEEGAGGKVTGYELTKDNIQRFFESHYEAEQKALEALQAETEATAPEEAPAPAPAPAPEAEVEPAPVAEAGPSEGHEGLLMNAKGRTFEISHEPEQGDFHSGDRVRVYTAVQLIIHPMTGENLGAPQVDLGEATIQKVSDGSYKLTLDADPIMTPEKSASMRLVPVLEATPTPAAEAEPLVEFLNKDLDPKGAFAEIEAITDTNKRATALEKLDESAQRDYLRYRIQDVARDVRDTPDSAQLASKLREGLEKGGDALGDAERAALEQMLERK